MTTSPKVGASAVGAPASGGDRVALAAAPDARCAIDGCDWPVMVASTAWTSPITCYYHRACDTEGCRGYALPTMGLCRECFDREREEAALDSTRREREAMRIVPAPVLCPHGFSDRLCYDCRSDEAEIREVHINHNERF